MQLDLEILGRRSKSWIYFFLGLIFITAVCSISVIAYIYLIVKIIGITRNEFVDSETARALFWLLLSVAIFIIPVWLWIKFVHKRSLTSLISPYGSSAKSALKIAIIFFGTYFFLGEAVGLFIPFIETEMVWKPALWLKWILPMTIVIFLQTSAEEILFRGYIQQYLAALIPYRAVYYIVPTLIWMVLHFGNVDGFYTNIAALFSIFVLGIIFADWVDRSKSLWGPMIVHFLNNFVLICIFGNSLEKSDLHIWRNNFDSLTDPMIAAMTVMSAAFMAITYIFLRPKIRNSAF